MGKLPLEQISAFQRFPGGQSHVTSQLEGQRGLPDKGCTTGSGSVRGRGSEDSFFLCDFCEGVLEKGNPVAFRVSRSNTMGFPLVLLVWGESLPIYGNVSLAQMSPFVPSCFVLGYLAMVGNHLNPRIQMFPDITNCSPQVKK